MTVYLDHAATSPLLPEALAAYTAALATVGNPSSIHSAGQQARRALEEAREEVAASLSCEPVELIFTSGGTESVNLAIKGLWWARQSDRPRRRVLVPEGEHHATLDTVEWLERHEGAHVEWLPLDEHGRLRLDALEAALATPDDVALLTMLWANNEVGTVQPVAEAAALAEAAAVPVHADAIAAYGQVPVALNGLAALSVSAHKIGGPLGIGALAVARSATVEPLLHGGSQQRVRSGTQDAPAAIGFAAAARLAHGPALAEHSARLEVLRDRLERGVTEVVPEAVRRGHPTDRLPGNAHFTFPGCEGDSLLFLLDMAGVAVSTGSACRAGVPEVSHVLRAMGLDESEARGAMRVTLGHGSTEADIDALLAALPGAYAAAARAGRNDRALRRGNAAVR